MDGHSRIQLSASFNLLKNPLRWLPVAGRELCATCDAEASWLAANCSMSERSESVSLVAVSYTHLTLPTT